MIYIYIYIHTHTYTYTYIYVYLAREREWKRVIENAFKKICLITAPLTRR